MSRSMFGLVVDGHGDHAAMREKYKGKAFVLKTSGSRGHHSDARLVAISSLKEVEMLIGLGCKKICLVTDLESRSIDAKKFADELEKHLPKKDGHKLLAVCANQMIENWILADITEVAKHSKELRKGLKQRRWEGTHGKNELKKCMSQGADYSEVKHGPKFFLLVRDDVARKNSASYDDFLSKIQS